MAGQLGWQRGAFPSLTGMGKLFIYILKMPSAFFEGYRGGDMHLHTIAKTQRLWCMLKMPSAFFEGYRGGEIC